MLEIKAMLLWSTIMSIVCAASVDAQFATMAIGVCFTGNVIFGIMVDIMVNKKHFSFSKFCSAMGVLLVFLCCVFCIALVGRLMGDIELSKPAIKWVSYFFLYYIFTNILKNLMQLQPKVIVWEWLYSLLTLTFTKKLKELGITFKKPDDEK